MASQRILLIALAGRLADAAWERICQWSDARTVTCKTEWSPDDWPLEVCNAVDRFIATINRHALEPPVVYRSEHVDLWSMGDVFALAASDHSPAISRRLYTQNYELHAMWIATDNRVYSDKSCFPETAQFYARIHEAMAAFDDCVERKLLLLIRAVLGGLWTDDEVMATMDTLPDWWNAAT